MTGSASAASSASTSNSSSSSFDFARILQQSNELNARISGSRNIPMMYRGLEQVEASLTKLSAKAGIFATELKY